MTITIPEGDFNLVVSALGMAAAEARHPGVGEDPGQFLIAQDRLFAQLPEGGAGERARAHLHLLAEGATPQQVYPTAYKGWRGGRTAVA